MSEKKITPVKDAPSQEPDLNAEFDRARQQYQQAVQAEQNLMSELERVRTTKIALDGQIAVLNKLLGNPLNLPQQASAEDPQDSSKT